MSDSLRTFMIVLLVSVNCGLALTFLAVLARAAIKSARSKKRQERLTRQLRGLRTPNNGTPPAEDDGGGGGDSGDEAPSSNAARGDLLAALAHHPATSWMSNPMRKSATETTAAAPAAEPQPPPSQPQGAALPRRASFKPAPSGAGSSAAQALPLSSSAVRVNPLRRSDKGRRARAAKPSTWS